MQEQSSSSQETNETPTTTTVEAQEVITPTPPNPEELTEKQKRQLRRLYVTRVNPITKACGHQLHPDKPPTNNCVYCWQAYFHVVANIEELFGALRELGVKKFTAKYGMKFTKNLRGFVAAELMAKKEEKKPEVEVEGEKMEIEGSLISSTEVKEAACELQLPVSNMEKA